MSRNAEVDFHEINGHEIVNSFKATLIKDFLNKTADHCFILRCGHGIIALFQRTSGSSSGEQYFDMFRRNIGSTENLRERIRKHNADVSAHAAKYRPWKLKTYIALDAKAKALRFERYLKSGSGRVFCKRHFD